MKTKFKSRARLKEKQFQSHFSKRPICENVSIIFLAKMFDILFLSVFRQLPSQKIYIYWYLSDKIMDICISTIAIPKKYIY